MVESLIHEEVVTEIGVCRVELTLMDVNLA